MTAFGVACTGAGSSTSDLPTTAPSTAPGPAAPTAAPEAAALTVRSAGYQLVAPIQRSVAVWDGGVIYIAGGLDAADTTVGGVFSMNPTSGRLTPLGSLAQPVHDAAAAMIGGKLYVFAGGAGTGSDIVQAFDPATGTGSVVGHLPVALSDLAAAQIGGVTYLVGGYDGTQPRSEIYATADGTTFSTVGHLPVGLRYPAVTQVGGRLVIAGGLASSGPVNHVYTFDPSSGATTLTARLPAPVAHAAAFTLGGRIYVVGGRNASDAALAGASEIDPTTWHVEAEPPLGQPVADAAVAAGRRILLIGGWNTSTSSKVLLASLRAETATTASPGSGGSGTSKSERPQRLRRDRDEAVASLCGERPLVRVRAERPAGDGRGDRPEDVPHRADDRPRLPVVPRARHTVVGHAMALCRRRWDERARGDRPAHGQAGTDHPRGRAPVQPLLHPRRFEGHRRRGVLRPAATSWIRTHGS